MQDDDEVPMTGKLKGGPKKVSDVKPSKMPKIAAPKVGKSAGKGGGGLAAGLKAASKGGKLSSPKAPNFVKGHVSTKKADTKFSIPKPGMKAIKKGKK